MAKKKKKKRSQPTMLSPKKYIMTKARSLPFYECWINKGWREGGGLVLLFISRLQPSGKLIVANYLIDIFCLGVKNAVTKFSTSVEEFHELTNYLCNDMDTIPEQCDPVFAQNLVYGAVEYAEELGFKPHRDYDFTLYVLDHADEIEFIDIEFGKDGRPFLIRGPFDDFAKNIAILNRSVGEGNYDFLARIGEGDDDFAPF